jgi:hypothetical protein
MTTQTESPEVVATPRKRPTRGRRSTPGFRITLPLVYAGMGVALGTLTGMTMALITVPADASVAIADVAPPSGITASTSNSAVTVSQPAKNDQQPAVANTATDAKSNDASQETPAASSSPAESSTTKNQEQSVPSPKPQDVPSKAPAAEANPDSQIVPAEAHPRKHIAHPLAVSARTVLASTPEVVEVSLDNEQLSMVDEVKSTATFYSEGDLTVADYNATAGTIETSDGRTFVLGTTVSASSAASWDDYRSSVHYRCDQGGSCMLMRAGAVAPNAKLI